MISYHDQVLPMYNGNVPYVGLQAPINTAYQFPTYYPLPYAHDTMLHPIIYPASGVPAPQAMPFLALPLVATAAGHPAYQTTSSQTVFPVNESSKPTGPWFCDKCGKEFTRYSRYQKHEDKENDRRMYKCGGKCGKRGWYVGSLPTLAHGS